MTILKEELIQNNTLIAEFMGYKVIDNEIINFEHIVTKNIYDYPIRQAHYHTDWNWLMPIVGKIEKLFEDEPKVRGNGCSYVRVLHLDDYLRSANIEEVYKIVVGFIEWYNENKKS